MAELLQLPRGERSSFRDELLEILPEGGHLTECLTCGLCASGCPAAGLHDMDPRKYLRLAAYGLDAEVLGHPWAWCCTMCQRCSRVCPMSINIPALVSNVRGRWPVDDQPEGIRHSCNQALDKETCSAMGCSVDDWHFVVEDVAEEVRDLQPGWEALQAPMDRQGAKFFLNQNSREPMTEPEEMIPLWKILHRVGADWTYGSTGWAAENYCLFLFDTPNWERIVRTKAAAVDGLESEILLNTE